MMRLLLALFLGLLAYGTAQKFVVHEGQRQLVYRYEVQLSTGSPESSQLWSSLKLTANLTLQINNEYVVAQLKKVYLQKMDRLISEDTPNFAMQEQATLLESIQAEIDSDMIAPLQMPFRFRWMKGQINNVTFSNSSQSLFSLNIKKGVLNILQINMGKIFSLDVDKDKSFNINGQKESYTVLEPSPFGACLTTYTPELVPDTTDKDIMYMTKVRNYSSCYQKPPMGYSFDNLNTSNTQSTDHLNLQAEVKYGLRGNKRSFIIESAFGQSKVIFVPYSRKDGSVQTSINQTMFLLEQTNLTRSQPSFSGIRQNEPIEALAMSLPIATMDDRQPYIIDPLMMTIKHARSIKNNSPWTVKKMDQLLSLVANTNSVYPSEQLMLVNQALMEMIRQSNQERLESLWDQQGPMGGASINYQEQEEQEEQGWKSQQQEKQRRTRQLKRSIMWNLLSNAGTSTASMVVLKECLNGDDLEHPSKEECTSAVTRIGLYTPPSESIIKKMIELITVNEVMDDQQLLAIERSSEGDQHGQEDISEKKELREVTVLALGSVLGRGEQMVHDMKKFASQRLMEIEMIKEQYTTKESQDQLKKMEDDIKSHRNKIENAHMQIYNVCKKKVFKKLSKEGEKILLLKTLRNAHIRISLPFIRKLIEADEDHLVRIAAAQALETFTEEPIDDVLSILEREMKQPTNPVSLRIQAFRSLVNLQPPVHSLVRIADNIAYEKDKQLSTYVWSVFNRMANSTFRPYLQTAATFRDAMALLQPVQYGFQDSQYGSMQVDLADEVTALKEVSIVSGPDHSANLDISSTLDIFGTSSKCFQVTIMSEGLQQILKRFVGPNGFLTKRNSILDLLQRPRREKRDAGSVQGIINRIFKKLDIKERLMPIPQAYVDIQVMNRVVRLYKLSDFIHNLNKKKPFIPVDIDEERLAVSIPIDLKSSGIVNQFYMELPTEAGFPINLHMGLAFSAKVKGTMKASVDPSIYKSKRNGFMPNKLEAGIDVEPRLVGALTGKMSVDGFLLQTGNMFQATINMQKGGRANVCIDLIKSRFTARLEPDVSKETPMLKMEVKPYVFSLAISRDVVISQRADPTRDIKETNARPIFITMQPVAICHGARLKQVDYHIGEKEKGYQVTLQGQYPTKALYSSPAKYSPLMGRSHFALYVDSGIENLPGLVADVRYFSHSRYPEKACDSWFSWQCYSTGEDSPAPELPEPTKPTLEMGKIRDIPDLDSKITLHQLKADIMNTLGQKMPMNASKTEWGFVAVLNGSSSTVVKGLSQTWNRGQYNQFFITVHNKPVFVPNDQPWRMNIKNVAIYPGKVYDVWNLMDSSYQAQVHDKIFSLMQRKEHKVINKGFQNLLFTIVSNLDIQRLPSMDPQSMLDRMMPEYILMSKSPKVMEVRHILKRLLPLTQLTIDLESHTINAFTIERSQDLLKDIQERIKFIQREIQDLIEKVGKVPSIPRNVITSIEYAVLKLTQAVLHSGKVIMRAVRLDLVEHPKDLYNRQVKIDETQKTIYRLCLANFGSKERKISREYSFESREYIPILGYDSAEVPESRNEAPTVDEVIYKLQALTQQQLQQILAMWEDIQTNKMSEHNTIQPLIRDTTDNITFLNLFIKEKQMPQNWTAVTMMAQSAIQHQMLVHMLRVSRIKSDDSQTINNVDRYGLKVQTKQLLERAAVLQHQIKMNMVCMPQLNATEQGNLQKLQVIDRQLVAVQQDHITLPSPDSPWTADARNLSKAANQMYVRWLYQLRQVRDKMLQVRDAIPHPCLVAKLVNSAYFLQQRVSMFRRTLLAQPMDQTVPFDSYQQLDDESMEFLLSLSPLFDIYVTANSTYKDDIFPNGEILISESLMEVQRIRRQQRGVMHQMLKYLDQPYNLPFDQVWIILSRATDNSRMLLNELKVATQRFTQSMKTSTPMTAYAVYHQFLNAMDDHINMLDQIEGYLKKFPKFQSKLGIRVSRQKKMMEEMKASLQQLMKSPGSQEMDASSPSVEEAAENYPNMDGMKSIYDEESPLSSSSIFEEDYDTLERGERVARSADWSIERVVPDSQKQLNRDIMKEIRSDMDPLFDGIIFNTNITYGDKNYLGIQVLAKKSLGQLLWEASQFYPNSRDEDVSHTVDDAIMGRKHMNARCAATCLKLNSYNHVHMHIASYSNELPPVVKRFVENLMVRNMAKNYHKSELTGPQPFIRPGTVQAIVDVSHLMDSMDEYIMTAQRTLTVKSKRMCPYLMAINPFQNSMPVTKLVQKEFSHGLMPAECKFQQDNVKTTDGYMYTLPALKQQTLLAADCSPEKTFAILIDNSTSWKDWTEEQMGQPKKELKILAQSYQVKLVPGSLSVGVEVDDANIELKPNQPYVRYTTLDSGEKHVALVISLKDDGIVQVMDPLVGLEIHFSVDCFTLQMSKVYANQLCGLCANFDGQTTWEMEGPQEQVFKAPSLFVESYGLKGEISQDREEEEESQNRSI